MRRRSFAWLWSLTCVACTASDLDRLSAAYGAGTAGAAAGATGGSAGTGGAGAKSGASGAGGAAGGSAGVGGKSGGAGTGGHAGAGTGGSAGTSGAGGATAGAGGAVSCDGPTTSCNGCSLCAQQPNGPCAAVTAACVMNPECGALQDCQAACTTDTCSTMCDEAHAMGVAAYNAYNSCEATACKEACSAKLVCSGIPKGAGACFATEPCNAVTNVPCKVAAGEACDFDATTKKFACMGPPPAKTAPLCGACDQVGCAPGMICVTVDAAQTVYKCTPFCCTDADCGPTGTCFMSGYLPEGGWCAAK